MIAALLSGASGGQMAILRTLACRPEEWLTVDELARGLPTRIGRPAGDRTSVGGTLGSLAGRAKRLGMKSRGPFDVRFDPNTERYEYRMSERVAALVLAAETRTDAPSTPAARREAHG
jgi:hypothetical protein